MRRSVVHLKPHPSLFTPSAVIPLTRAVPALEPRRNTASSIVKMKSCAMVASRSARYNVVAEYPDLPAARPAIEALQIHGVEAANIHISGPGAVIALKASSVPDTSKIDARLATRIFSRSVAGMIVSRGRACQLVRNLDLTPAGHQLLSAEYERSYEACLHNTSIPSTARHTLVAGRSPRSWWQASYCYLSLRCSRSVRGQPKS